jgi:hypothetical protein
MVVARPHQRLNTSEDGRVRATDNTLGGRCARSPFGWHETRPSPRALCAFRRCTTDTVAWFSTLEITREINHPLCEAHGAWQHITDMTSARRNMN